MFRLTCPHCQTKIELPAQPANGIVACVTCGKRLQVRAAGATPQKPGESGAAPRAAAPARPPAPQPPAYLEAEEAHPRSKRDAEDRPRRRRPDDDDDRPRRSRKHREEGSNSRLAWIIGGSVAAVAILGTAIVLFFVLRDKQDSPVPVAKGPGNPFARGGQPGGGIPPPPGGFDTSPDDQDKPPPPTRPAGGAKPSAPAKTGSDTTARNDPPSTSEQPRDFGGAGSGGGTGVYPYLLKSAAFIVVVVEVQTPQGLAYGMAGGSGSLVDKKNRLLLTNHHVAGQAKEIFVFFPTYQNGKLVAEKDRFLNQVKDKDKDIIRGKVVASEMRCDLCLLQLDRLPDGIEALPLSKVQATPGQPVHSIGNPGTSGGLWVYTSGTVRQVYHKRWRAGTPEHFTEHDADVVETQSPTNPGDSGGPLVNDRGELVGVTQGGSSVGNLVSVFVDLSEVRKFVVSAVESKLGTAWVSDARPPLQLASRGGGGNVTDLIKNLEHADAAQRARAAENLGEMGENAKIAFPGLLKALKDKDELTRRLAAAALAKLGSPGASDVPLLASALKDENAEVRQYAINTLAKMGPDAKSATDALVGALKDENATVRQTAARTLGKLGPDAKSSAAKELTVLLDHMDKESRLAAAEALAGLLNTAADIPALQKLSKHQDAEVRAFGFKGLAKLGKDAKGVLPELLEAAKTDTGETRKAALMILTGLTPADAKPVVAMINQAIKDGDKETKQLSLQLVAKLGNDASSCASNTRDALRDPDVKKEALVALGKLGMHAKTAVPAMADCAKDMDQSIRDAALKALGDLGINGAAATNDLINLFEKGKESKSQEEASVYLEKIAAVIAKFGRPAVPSLIKALQEDSAMIRWGACKALGLMGSLAKEADRHLQALSQAEPNLFISQEADKARRRISAR